MKSTLHLCGVGNVEGIRLASNVARASGRWAHIVLLDDDPARHGTRKLGLEVAGGFELLAAADPARCEVANLVTRTVERRSGARERIARHGIPFASLIHPDVDLLGVEVAEEVTIYPHASAGAEARIGAGAVLLVGARVGHGVEVGAGCLIAPNAVVNARVVLGPCCYVGSNATVLPDLVLGPGVTVAANSLVTEDVPAGATVMGVPARVVGGAGRHAPDGGLPPAVPPRPGGERPETGCACPTSSLAWERALSDALREVLGVEEVPCRANFFELGADSLKVLRVRERIRGHLGVEVDLLDFYRYPTLQALGSHLAVPGPAVPGRDPARERADLRRRLRPGR